MKEHSLPVGAGDVDLLAVVTADKLDTTAEVGGEHAHSVLVPGHDATRIPSVEAMKSGCATRCGRSFTLPPAVTIIVSLGAISGSDWGTIGGSKPDGRAPPLCHSSPAERSASPKTKNL